MTVCRCLLSASEIAAVSGHVSLREVERYTKAADQERMARSSGHAVLHCICLLLMLWTAPALRHRVP
jgi:hypothetical protein